MAREWSRRSFIHRGVLGGLLLGAAGAGTLAAWKGATRAFGFIPTSLDEPALAVLDAIARRLLPEGDGFPTMERLQLLPKIDALLAGMDEKTRHDVRGLLHLFDNALLSFLFGGPPRPFTRLEPDAQSAVLTQWETSVVTLRRTGFQSLRTLILGCYFGSSESWTAMGYPGPPEGFHQPSDIPWRGGGVPRPPEEP